MLRYTCFVQIYSCIKIIFIFLPSPRRERRIILGLYRLHPVPIKNPILSAQQMFPHKFPVPFQACLPEIHSRVSMESSSCRAGQTKPGSYYNGIYLNDFLSLMLCCCPHLPPRSQSISFTSTRTFAISSLIAMPFSSRISGRSASLGLIEI